MVAQQWHRSLYISVGCLTCETTDCINTFRLLPSIPGPVYITLIATHMYSALYLSYGLHACMYMYMCVAIVLTIACKHYHMTPINVAGMCMITTTGTMYKI